MAFIPSMGIKSSPHPAEECWYQTTKRIAKVRFWATQARDPARHYQHSEIGYNYRMSNVVAGIGRGQLKVLDQRIAKKKNIFEYYKRELGDLDGIEFMPINEWNEPNYWLTCITLHGKVKPLDIILALEKEDIESRPLWKPMHMQPFTRNVSLLVQAFHGNYSKTGFVYRVIQR